TCGDGRPTHAVRSVAAGDEVARRFVTLPGVTEQHPGPLRLEVSDADVFGLKEYRLVGAVPRGNQILHYFVLPVDRDRPAAGQLRQRNPMALAVECEINAFVPEAFT